MEQISFFQPELPADEHLQYLADLLKMKSRSRKRERFMEKILKVLKPKVREWEQAIRKYIFEPNIEPELLLFYADYKGLVTKERPS